MSSGGATPPAVFASQEQLGAGGELVGFTSTGIKIHRLLNLGGEVSTQFEQYAKFKNGNLFPKWWWTLKND